MEGQARIMDLVGGPDDEGLVHQQFWDLRFFLTTPWNLQILRLNLHLHGRAYTIFSFQFFVVEAKTMIVFFSHAAGAQEWGNMVCHLNCSSRADR